MDIDWTGIGLLKITNKGSSNFAVWTYDESGDKDLIVNTIGAYSGTHPLNFMKADQINRIQIKSSGSWTVEMDPVTSMFIHSMEVPGQSTGKGDDVVWLTGGEIPDIARIVHVGESNFAVWTLGDYKDLIVNEIGAYTGETVIDSDNPGIYYKSRWGMDYRADCKIKPAGEGGNVWILRKLINAINKFYVIQKGVPKWLNGNVLNADGKTQANGRNVLAVGRARTQVKRRPGQLQQAQEAYEKYPVMICFVFLFPILM